MGARILWLPWQTNRSPAWRDPGFAITEMFGPDVIALAVMYCPEDGIGAEELDFRLLCWELFGLGSFADAESNEAAAERARISSRWSEILDGTRFSSLDGRALATYVRGLWMRGRLFTTDAPLRVSIDDDILRVVFIHDALERIVHDSGRFLRLRDVYFRNDPVRLLQHGCGLIGRVPDAIGADTPCPGRFDVYAEDLVQSEVVDFAHFGDLACTPASELRTVGAALNELPDHQRKLDPASHPLSRRPGIVLDDREDIRAFFYPTPRRLLRSFHKIFVDDFIDFLSAQHGFEHAPGLLGLALHELLCQLAGDLALSIDDADCPVQGKKPDAVFCGDRFGVVIEAKSRLTPRSDPECISPDSLLEAWSRAWEAVDQAESFLRDPRTAPWLLEKLGRVPSVWVVLLAIGEADAAARTSFRHATSRWDLLSGTKLSGVAVFSFGALEAALRSQSADTLGRWIERTWLEAGVDALQQPAEEPIFPSLPRATYLDEAFRRLVSA